MNASLALGIFFKFSKGKAEPILIAASSLRPPSAVPRMKLSAAERYPFPKVHLPQALSASPLQRDLLLPLFVSHSFGLLSGAQQRDSFLGGGLDLLSCSPFA